MARLERISYQDLDFDAWSQLAERDPERFETLRLAAIDELIDRASEPHKQRLRALQWRIDQECRLAGSALTACVRVSRMMWEQVTGTGGLVDTMQRLGSGRNKGSGSPIPRPRAEVISMFERESET